MFDTLAPSYSVTTREPKGRKFISIVEAAYNKAGLSEEEAQRINESPGLADLVNGFIADHRLTDRYKDEEVSSHYGHHSGYAGPKPLYEQLRILRKHFPEVVACDISIPDRELPQGAEGWFVIPRWERIASTYGEAVDKVLDALSKAYSGRFYNYCEGWLGPDRLRQSVRSAAVWEKLGSEQTGDVLVAPAQFGIRHRDYSVRSAREVLSGSEFGLGVFAVGVMLLSHPERFRHSDDLWIDCAGDECHDLQLSATPFDHAPLFRFDDGTLKFGTLWLIFANDVYGSASAWVV